MKTYFTILYLTINASLKEKVSVGMIMSNNQESFFRFSSQKLNILKQLISHENYIFLKLYFKNLENEFNHNKLDVSELNLKTDLISNNWVNEKYISYLNRYSNNMVMFSKPKGIEILLNYETFNKLFKKYIFVEEDSLNKKIKSNIISLVTTRLYSKIEDKVNLNALITPKDFKELIVPVNINFIGKNGLVITGQTVDFSKRNYDLKNDLTSYISFTKAVDLEQKKLGQYFLVGDEPDKKEYSKNHDLWRHIFESKMVEYVDIKETEKIKEYIDTKNVTPYFDVIED